MRAIAVNTDSLQDFSVFSDNIANSKFFPLLAKKGVADSKIFNRFICGGI
jgi:hypothetical protein